MSPLDGSGYSDPTFTRLTVLDSIGGPSGPLALRADPRWDMDAATMRWTAAFVNDQVCQAIQSLLATYPSVWSWNGRVGDVWMQLGDVERALYSLQGLQPPVYPTSPTPPLTSDDDTIATTAWVTNAIGDIVTDEINSQGLASKSWVQANTVTSFNGRQGVVNLTLTDVTNVGGAPNNSPNFTGNPQAPTAPPGTATPQIATTAFVQAAIASGIAGVSSFNERTGAVVLGAADLLQAGGALTTSPAFTGTPTAPTAAQGTNTTQLATTAFVQTAISNIVAGVASFNGRSGVVTLQLTDVTGVGGAPIASPALTGTPTAPTAAPGTNTTQLATTAFVMAAITSLNAAVVTTFNGRQGNVIFTANDLTAAGGIVNPSPALTGVPTAPTPDPGDNSTAIATTAFVDGAIANISAVTSFNGRNGAVVLTTADVSGVGGALLASPTFSGTPAAPTAPPGTNTTQLATTAFVTAAIAALSTGVASFNTRTGAVTFQTSDITGVGGALLASPAFSGTPTAPTAAAGTSTTQIATTAFVMAALSAGNVSSFNGRTGAVTLTLNDITAAGGAPIASPVFSGIPAGPTAAPGTDTTQLATTAFVTAALAGITGIVVSATAPTSPVAGAGWYNLNDGQTYIWTGTTWAIAVNPPVPNLSNYAQLSGATFTGPVSLPAGSTIVGYLPLAGGTMTGPVVLSGNATAALNPVSLQQLQAGYLPLTGGSLSGALTVNAALTTTGLLTAANVSTGEVDSSFIRISATGSSLMNFVASNGTLVGSITTNGTTTTYNTTSDARLKADKAPFTDGREIIDRLRVRRFNWLSDGRDDIGIIAQDMYDIYPVAITAGHGNPSDSDFVPWSVDYSKYVPLLIESLQDAWRRIDHLEGLVIRARKPV